MTRAQESRNGLTSHDYAALEKCFITREIAEDAGIYRVVSLEGREIVGRRGGGDYAGIVFPYFMPETGAKPLERLRLDNPPVEAGSKKAAYKYLVASNSRNHLYFPPCDPALLKDITVPLLFVEGEKKCLAAWNAALQAGAAPGRPAFLPIGLAGVNGYRSTVEIRPNAKGVRVPHMGPLPDFDLLTLKDRKTTVLFDANAESNWKVKGARQKLACELERREAQVWIARQPEGGGLNGFDDYLGAKGLQAGLELLERATPYDWRSQLTRNRNGNIMPLLINAAHMLRCAPQWAGVLAFNEFSGLICPLRDAPWGPCSPWSDADVNQLCAWFEENGLYISTEKIHAAVDIVARENKFHLVRDYLDECAAKWDKKKRLDGWLTLYMGVRQSLFSCAVGAKFLISAVARIYEPGCKADCALILEGPQGRFKSLSIEALGHPWHTADMPEIGTKDASQAVRGVWIIELDELKSLIGVHADKVKSFMSRGTDRFRMPYGRLMTEAPRQCVFIGSTNESQYLMDDTGGRRFWPVQCGKIDLKALRENRDQLWAEAVVRYRAGDSWWLDTEEQERTASEEQEARRVRDPLEEKIAAHLETLRADPVRPAEITIAEILEKLMNKPSGQWVKGDEMRIGVILDKCKWERHNLRRGGRQVWVYTPVDGVAE